MAKKYVEVKNDMNYWKPKARDDQIEGKVLQVKSGDFGNQYEIADERQGDIWTPSHKVLQNRMQKVKKGDQVKIIYDGTEPPKVKGQNPTALYKVFVEEN